MIVWAEEENGGVFEQKRERKACFTHGEGERKEKKLKKTKRKRRGRVIVETSFRRMKLTQAFKTIQESKQNRKFEQFH